MRIRPTGNSWSCLHVAANELAIYRPATTFRVGAGNSQLYQASEGRIVLLYLVVPSGMP